MTGLVTPELSPARSMPITLDKRIEFMLKQRSFRHSRAFWFESIDRAEILFLQKIRK
jgi:hypothetical protein